MPRVDVPVQIVDRTTGIRVDTGETTADVANGHSFLNDGRTILKARNTDGAVIRNVTVVIPQTIDGQAVTNKAYAIPAAGGHLLIGPFPVSLYNQGTGADAQRVYVNVDNAALRLQALQIPS